MKILAESERLFITTIGDEDRADCMRCRGEENVESISYAIQRTAEKSAERDGETKKVEVQEAIDDLLWKEVIKPTNFNGTIRNKADNELIGLMTIDDYNGDEPELGINIRTDWQNKGIAPEAIPLFLRYCKGAFGIQKVRVRIKMKNTHSQHVFEKLGAVFQQEQSYLSEHTIAMIKGQLDGIDVSNLRKKSVRLYYLDT